MPTTPALPILYSFRRCPYAMRARLAVAVSGQRCELREVVLKQKPAELLAASPKATVPVLVLPGGAVIAQSLDIMCWALQQHDPQGWLGRDEAQSEGSLAQQLALIAACDAPFKHQLDRYKYPNRFSAEHIAEPSAAHGGADAAFAQFHRAGAARWLDELNARLAPQGWLFADSARLADMAILPFVRQFAHTDANWFAEQPWPHLQAWLARWASGALFDSVMGRYDAWRPGQAAVIFPA